MNRVWGRSCRPSRMARALPGCFPRVSPGVKFNRSRRSGLWARRGSWFPTLRAKDARRMGHPARVRDRDEDPLRSTISLCFNRTDGHSPEIYGAGAADCCPAQGA